MDRRRTRIVSTVTLLVCVVCCVASNALGSGFGVFAQGADGLGQADAVIAHGDGPSAAYFNPALITKLPGTQIEIGTTLIFPHREYHSVDGSSFTTQESVLVPPSTFYITHTLTDKLSGSFAVFNPFGLSTDWGDNWPGRFITTKADMSTFDFNPAVAYKVLPNLSVAAGFDLVVLSATLKSVLPSSALGIPGPSFDIPQKFSGSGEGVGCNFGLLYDINEALSFGISYRSQVVVSVAGNYYNNVSPPAGFPAYATVTLPQQLTVGIAYRPINPLVVEAGVRWEDWSTTKNLVVSVPGVSVSITPRDWHGTATINVGGKYRFNDTYSASLGYLYGWNPVPDSTFEPTIPDSNTHFFAVGGEGRFGNITLDLAYAYQLLYNRFKGPNLFGPIADGKYESDLHMLALSLGYRF